MSDRDPGNSIEMTRRQFVATTAAGTALFVARCAGTTGGAPVVATASAASATPPAGGAFTPPPLQWAEDGLEPHVSARTISFHRNKHHLGYVGKLEKAVAGTQFENMTLEQIIEQTHGHDEHEGIFNNAAQVFNHTFYFESMKPGGGAEPPGELLDRMKTAFGGFEGFREQFVLAASTQFGSGWAWLVVQDGDLNVVKTSNAQTPLTGGATPLLTIDVWEHAYYLDYQNRRQDYIDAWLGNLANWDFALSNLG
jgi:Fe-Mn family superoxide dismutase